MKNITKNQIIDQVSKRTGERKDLTIKMVNETFTVIREMICSADPEIRINIRDFGTIEVLKTKGRANARNPQTNEPVEVAPHRRTHFIAGQVIRDFLKRPL
jgi:nucleoid DNA-binding protein